MQETRRANEVVGGVRCFLFFSLFFKKNDKSYSYSYYLFVLFCNNNYVRVQSSFLPSSSNPIQASLRHHHLAQNYPIYLGLFLFYEMNKFTSSPEEDLIYYHRVSCRSLHIVHHLLLLLLSLPIGLFVYTESPRLFGRENLSTSSGEENDPRLCKAPQVI